MGRTRKALKIEKKAEILNPSQAIEEIQIVKENTSTAGTNLQPKMHDNAANLAPPNEKATHVRRSKRIRNDNATTTPYDLDTMHVNEEKSQNEDAQHICSEGKLLDKSISTEKRMKEKIGRVFQLVASQMKTIDEIMSKETTNAQKSDISREKDAKYKILYIESQKKIEALTEENCKLQIDIEQVHSKIEDYEKGMHWIPGVVENLKEALS